MSIDNIKEYYAKERGFENWSEFLNNIHGFQIPSHMTEVAQRYAQSKTEKLEKHLDVLHKLLDRIQNCEVHVNDSIDKLINNALDEISKL